MWKWAVWHKQFESCFFQMVERKSKKTYLTEHQKEAKASYPRYHPPWKVLSFMTILQNKSFHINFSMGLHCTSQRVFQTISNPSFSLLYPILDRLAWKDRICQNNFPPNPKASSPALFFFILRNAQTLDGWRHKFVHRDLLVPVNCTNGSDLIPMLTWRCWDVECKQNLQIETV